MVERCGGAGIFCLWRFKEGIIMVEALVSPGSRASHLPRARLPFLFPWLSLEFKITGESRITGP